MNRPWRIWIVFGLCLGVLLAAMGWVSFTALQLDRAQTEAQEQAKIEENVRLALWRMESMLAPLIVQESARPYFTYNAFYAAERAYNKMFNALQPGEVLVPSPLLTQVSSNIVLHFQYGPGGQLSSPQIPLGNQRDLAETDYTPRDRIESAIAQLRQFEEFMAQTALPGTIRNAGLTRPPAPLSGTRMPGGDRIAASNAPVAMLNRDVLLAACPPPQPRAGDQAKLPYRINRLVQQRMQAQTKSPNPDEDFAQQQTDRNTEELQARASYYQQAFDLNAKNAAIYAPPPRIQVAEGIARPIWFGDALMLARRVSVQGQDYLQGCWLDWPSIRQWLLENVKDLLPSAKLNPTRISARDPQSRTPQSRSRMLASLPVLLTPGEMPVNGGGLFTPVFFALALGWSCMLLAAAAVAMLLHGAVSLSERRGAFVSAVTHELRTPLTTFKMYSEMLADDMVPDAARRRQYLNTLCSEANRLSHLVENVLAYARLERGSARSRVEKVSLRQLIERVRPRLIQRAEQAGLELVEDSTPQALQTTVHVDVAAIEQILFNLVDNACKHAGPLATEKVIHLEALPNGKFAMLRVRDHGQGISPEGAKRLFRPFSKSSHELAHSAAGIGLGLALCRRLSRSMGGDLRLVEGIKTGACFELRLPLSKGDYSAASIG